MKPLSCVQYIKLLSFVFIALVITLCGASVVVILVNFSEPARYYWSIGFCVVSLLMLYPAVLMFAFAHLVDVNSKSMYYLQRIERNQRLGVKDEELKPFCCSRN